MEMVSGQTRRTLSVPSTAFSGPFRRRKVTWEGGRGVSRSSCSSESNSLNNVINSVLFDCSRVERNGYESKSLCEGAQKEHGCRKL